MIEVQVEVQNEHGVHARPATKVAQTAMKYSASLMLINNGMEADAKSVISLMMLAAVKGTMLTVKADGPDEEDAIKDIIALFDDQFGEA